MAIAFETGKFREGIPPGYLQSRQKLIETSVKRDKFYTIAGVAKALSLSSGDEATEESCIKFMQGFQNSQIVISIRKREQSRGPIYYDFDRITIAARALELSKDPQFLENGRILWRKIAGVIHAEVEGTNLADIIDSHSRNFGAHLAPRRDFGIMPDIIEKDEVLKAPPCPSQELRRREVDVDYRQLEYYYDLIRQSVRKGKLSVDEKLRPKMLTELIGLPFEVEADLVFLVGPLLEHGPVRYRDVTVGQFGKFLRAVILEMSRGDKDRELEVKLSHLLNDVEIKLSPIIGIPLGELSSVGAFRLKSRTYGNET